MKSQQNKVRAVAFDFDGVVVDSEPLYEKVQKKLFGEYGIVIPTEDWKYFKGLSEHDFYSLFQEKCHISASIEKLQKKGKELLKEELRKNLRYISGFRTFIKSIRNTYQIGLVTSTTRNFLEWIFENTPIENHFETMVTAEILDHQKPHPEPYLKIAEMMGVRPEEIIVIEDSINGVKSAKSASAITIAFLSSLKKEDFIGADYFATTYHEVSEILRSIAEQNKIFSCI